MASSSVATNAVMRRSTTGRTESWGLRQPLSVDQMVEEAIVRTASVEDKIRTRSTTYALRQIEPLSVMQRIPQTELEFLESSYGLPKSIR
jgi:hypothetical protein